MKWGVEGSTPDNSNFWQSDTVMIMVGDSLHTEVTSYIAANARYDVSNHLYWLYIFYTWIDNVFQ